MAKRSSGSQKHYKKRLKFIAKSKARRAELNKKQKLRVEFIAKEVQDLRKKREKEFFRAVEQKELSKKLKLLTQSDDDVSLPFDEVCEKSPDCKNSSCKNDIAEGSEINLEAKETIKKMQLETEETTSDECDQTHELNKKTSDHCTFIDLQSQTESSGLIALKLHDQLFKFHGHAKVTILKGACFINGFKMTSGDHQVVFAPVTHPAMVIKLADCEVHGGTISNVQKQSSKLDTLPEPLENYQAVVLFQSLSVADRPISLPGYARVYDLESLNMQPQKQLCSTCWQCDTTRHFIEHDFYSKALDSITSCSSKLKSSKNPHPHPVAVTVGGKNVGKSTLNRYLINRLLERYSHVYYFECDLGQTEFTPPGFLSIHKIKQTDPLLGTPFTHQLMPQYCCFYGNNNPQGNPTRYMECIEFLYNSFQQDLNGSLDAPLIINTMGWVRDAGAMLLIDIIRMVTPTHILQFESTRVKQNISPLTKSYIQQAEGWTNKSLRRLPTFELVLMKLTEPYSDLGKYKPSDNRVMSLLSHIEKTAKRCHLQQGLPMKQRCLRDLVQVVNPYCVSVSKVALCNAQDKASQCKFVLALFNASPVALCVAPTDVAEKLMNLSDDDIIPEPPVCRCVGLGLVRGVDVKKNALYIISDLQASDIKEVNCVIRGDLLLPKSFFTNNEKTKSVVNQPYISSTFPYDTVGSNSFRSYARMNTNVMLRPK